MIGIYKITNPKGEVYIGRSKSVPKRLLMHMYQIFSFTKLYNSFKLYGFNNHKLEVIFECKEKDLNMYEYYFIIKYDSVNNGLNHKSPYYELIGKAPDETSISYCVKTKSVSYIGLEMLTNKY